MFEHHKKTHRLCKIPFKCLYGELDMCLHLTTCIVCLHLWNSQSHALKNGDGMSESTLSDQPAPEPAFYRRVNRPKYEISVSSTVHPGTRGRTRHGAISGAWITHRFVSSLSEMKLEGSCYCKKVKFSVDSTTPQPFMRCYCSICRKTGIVYILHSPNHMQSNLIWVPQFSHYR